MSYTSRTPYSAPLTQSMAQGPDMRVAGQVSTTLAAALAEVGQQFAQVSAMAERQRQADRAEQGRIGIITELGTLRAGIETEPDPARVTARWMEGVTAIQKKVADAFADDPAVARVVGRDLAMMAARDHVEVLRLSVKRTTEASAAQLESTLHTLGNSAAAARDPAERQQFVNAAEQAIASRVAGGTLRADQAEKLRQGFLGRVDQAAVLGLISRAPAAAMSALADPSRFAGLDPVQRERLFSAAASAVNTATTRAEAAERRADAAARREGDRLANDLHVRIDRALAGGGEMPSFDDVARLRDMLSPGETSALLSRIRQAGAARDTPDAVADLSPEIDRLEPDEFNRRATAALRRGEITPDTYRTMLAQNRSARRDDAPASAYRSGRAFVSDALDPGNVVGGQFMRGPLAAARSNALADYDTWMQANPNATREQAIARARDLVASYQVGADAESKIALPRPYGFVGPRDQVTETDLQAAAQQALAARRGGRLTDEELQRQADVLDAWRAILAREAAARAPAAPAAGRRGGGVDTRPR